MAKPETAAVKSSFIVGREYVKKRPELSLLARSKSFCTLVLGCILKDSGGGSPQISCAVTLKKQKIQNGGQGPGLAIPTFFLWEIIQKFFFLSRGFHILATQKKYFCHPGGFQWGPGAILARFKAKKGWFRAIFYKNQSFIAFKAFFHTDRTSKHCKYQNKYL